MIFADFWLDVAPTICAVLFAVSFIAAPLLAVATIRSLKAPRFDQRDARRRDARIERQALRASRPHGGVAEKAPYLRRGG